MLSPLFYTVARTLLMANEYIIQQQFDLVVSSHATWWGRRAIQNEILKSNTVNNASVYIFEWIFLEKFIVDSVCSLKHFSFEKKKYLETYAIFP